MTRLVALAVLAAVASGCGYALWGDKPTATPGQPTATVRATATVTAAPAPTRADGVRQCGDGATVELVEGPKPGAYQEGERLVISVRYDAPGCVRAGAVIVGHHIRGSPWYEYWCDPARATPPRCGANLPSVIRSTESALRDAQGVVEIVGEAGEFPPTSLGSPAPAEGFVACSAYVTLNDGVFGGAYIERQFAFECTR